MAEVRRGVSRNKSLDIDDVFGRDLEKDFSKSSNTFGESSSGYNASADMDSSERGLGRSRSRARRGAAPRRRSVSRSRGDDANSRSVADVSLMGNFELDDGEEDDALVFDKPAETEEKAASSGDGAPVRRVRRTASTAKPRTAGTRSKGHSEGRKSSEGGDTKHHISLEDKERRRSSSSDDGHGKRSSGDKHIKLADKERRRSSGTEGSGGRRRPATRPGHRRPATTSGKISRKNSPKGVEDVEDASNSSEDQGDTVIQFDPTSIGAVSKVKQVKSGDDDIASIVEDSGTGKKPMFDLLGEQGSESEEDNLLGGKKPYDMAPMPSGGRRGRGVGRTKSFDVDDLLGPSGGEELAQHFQMSMPTGSWDSDNDGKSLLGKKSDVVDDGKKSKKKKGFKSRFKKHEVDDDEDLSDPDSPSARMKNLFPANFTQGVPDANFEEQDDLANESDASSSSRIGRKLNGIGKWMSRRRPSMSSSTGPEEEEDDMSTSQRSVGSRLFGGRKKADQGHLLLGDDEDEDSDVVF